MQSAGLTAEIDEEIMNARQTDEQQQQSLFAMRKIYMCI